MSQRLAETVTGELLASIGTKQPVPGGGAVASLVASLSAALGEMVVAYSKGKRALAEHDALHSAALAALASLRVRALDLADEDAEAYRRLNELWRLDESDPARAGFQDAVRGAIAAPRAVLDAAVEVMELLAQLAGVQDGGPRTNRFLDSDLAIAAILADAAGQAAAWNIRINLPQLEDAAERERQERDAITRLAALRAQLEAIDKALAPAR